MATNAQIAANQAKQSIDVAMALNLDDLRRSGKLNSYLNENKERVLQDIYAGKDNNMSKIMGDLGRAIDSQKNTYYYWQRNQDLLKLGKDPVERMAADAKAIMHDKDLALRQYEINQWTSGNRADTLFVYQLIFIAVLVMALFTALWRAGMIGTGFVGFLAIILIVIIVFTIVNRAQYTAFLRNKRYWNKREFPRFAAPSIPTPECPSATELLSGISDKVTTTAANAPNALIGGLQSGLSGLAGAASSAGQGLNTLRR